MGISDKTRKVLWGRSGSLCAFCKARMVVDASSEDSESVVGEECHIVSGKKKGPRYDANYDPDAIDNIRNLILLCRVHHKLVDDQADTFTAPMLRQLRENHENWVKAKLSEPAKAEPIGIYRKSSEIPKELVLVKSAKVLVDLARDCQGRYDDYPEDLTDDKLETVGAFLQNLSDWVDVGILEPSDRISAQKSLAADMSELDRANLRVYAAHEKQQMRGGVAGPTNIRVLHLKVVHEDDPTQTTRAGGADG